MCRLSTNFPISCILRSLPRFSIFAVPGLFTPHPDCLDLTGRRRRGRVVGGRRQCCGCKALSATTADASYTRCISATLMPVTRLRLNLSATFVNKEASRRSVSVSSSLTCWFRTDLLLKGCCQAGPQSYAWTQNSTDPIRYNVPYIQS